MLQLLTNRASSRTRGRLSKCGPVLIDGREIHKSVLGFPGRVRDGVAEPLDVVLHAASAVGAMVQNSLDTVGCDVVDDGVGALDLEAIAAHGARELCTAR